MVEGAQDNGPTASVQNWFSLSSPSIPLSHFLSGVVKEAENLAQ